MSNLYNQEPPPKTARKLIAKRLFKAFMLGTLTAGQANAACPTLKHSGNPMQVASTSGCRNGGPAHADLKNTEHALPAQTSGASAQLLPVASIHPPALAVDRVLNAAPNPTPNQNIFPARSNSHAMGNALSVPLPVAMWSFLVAVIGALAFNKNRKPFKEQPHL